MLQDIFLQSFKPCGIYEIENSKGRVSYKILTGNEDLQIFLNKNKHKKCKRIAPVFTIGKYKEYPHTEIRKLTSDEIRQYMGDRSMKNIGKEMEKS